MAAAALVPLGEPRKTSGPPVSGVPGTETLLGTTLLSDSPGRTLPLEGMVKADNGLRRVVGTRLTVSGKMWSRVVASCSVVDISTNWNTLAQGEKPAPGTNAGKNCTRGTPSARLVFRPGFCNKSICQFAKNGPPERPNVLAASS